MRYGRPPRSFVSQIASGSTLPSLSCLTDRPLGATPRARDEVVALDRASQAALEGRQLALVLGPVQLAAREAVGGVPQLAELRLAVGAHPAADLGLVGLAHLGHRQHVGLTTALDDFLGDPIE